MVATAASSIAPGPSASLFITSKDECVARTQAMFMYWRQRCKIKWDAFGDTHSRLLFASVQARKRKFFIHSLQNNEGTTVRDGPQLHQLISDFYLDLFENVPPLEYDWGSLHLPSLSVEDKGLLMSPFSGNDIRHAMFHISDNKSPGPDGFSAAFFKLHWNVVGDHVIQAVQFFFAHGFMLKNWNRTFLILLPKVLHPESVSQFRPIGLCNVIYKCIAKCLTHRMRLVLPSLISDTHNAFVPGRLMSDECLVAHELMSYINRVKAKNKFCAVVKLDMNKAYDRVRWDFLFQALHEFGFPPYWVNIIRQCVTSVSYQVLVNGEPSRSFNPKCGLRQGNPLSPYLFVLCMEVLSALLRRAEQEHLIQGISVCRGASSISHLFFADDSLLFFRVSPRECDQVISILEEFSGLSGQVINYKKSFVKFSPNTPQDYRDYLAASLRLGQRSSLGPYLGVPVDIGRSKCSGFFDLVDIIARKLANFSSLHLSAAAKLVVINSVLVASITHVLSVFLIPKSICDRIDSLCLRFWWRSSAASKGMAMVSSSLLHFPKGMGGLGVRKISTFNQALLAKTAWRIVHHPQLLVSRLYQTRYPALAIHPPSTRVSCPSWGFRSLSRGFQVLDQGIAWKPGAGTRIRILQDTWVSMDRISFRSSVNGLDCPTHVSSLLDSRSYAWNIGMVRRLFPDKISSQILALERPTSETDDFLYWKFALDGKFTVRSAYAMLLRSSHHAAGVTSLPSSSWWKHFWGLDIIPRFKLFFWKLLHQALPLATFLCQRGLPVDPLCSLCNQDPESDLQLFRNCPLLLNLWSSGPLRMFCPSVALDRFIPWCVQFANNLSSGPLGLLDCFISMLWAIWVLRNHARFRNVPWDPGAFHVMVEGWRGRCVEVRLLRRSSKESPLFQGSSSRVAAISGLSNLYAGPTGITVDICLLSDGAWVSSNNNAGIGWILQDPISLIQQGGGAQACVLASALQAELTACLRGVEMAVRRGYSRLLIYSDSSILVGLLNGSSPGPVSVIWLVCQLRDILHSLTWFSVRKGIAKKPKAPMVEVQKKTTTHGGGLHRKKSQEPVESVGSVH
ncbi:uncharacterized protein [Spinacia oleracea]|uniref:Reverse transcriptase domain-containing protein n=1 Tax=Spinacia oleracea TaxID=3562 RepID=A0A9R0HZP1_SPIOL|nr:uncharacterized protein LOC110779815 [Spinacia oleracea]